MNRIVSMVLLNILFVVLIGVLVILFLGPIGTYQYFMNTMKDYKIIIVSVFLTYFSLDLLIPNPKTTNIVGILILNETLEHIIFPFLFLFLSLIIPYIHIPFFFLAIMLLYGIILGRVRSERDFYKIILLFTLLYTIYIISDILLTLNVRYSINFDLALISIFVLSLVLHFYFKRKIQIRWGLHISNSNIR